MAFRNDPTVVGLRPGSAKPATSTPRSETSREGKPDAAAPGAPVPPADPAEACRQAYTEFREMAAKTERRWQWIAAITGAAGLGLGAAVGVWQGRRRANAALPEST
jgi:hypothetical protein